MVMARSATGVVADQLDAEVEGLIKEARRRRRRRLARRALVGVVVVGVGAAVAALSDGGTRSPTPGASAGSGALPSGSFATLHVAGPLAVAPDGALYVTDVVRARFEAGGDRVLVRLPDGRFRVIAGSGRAGFSGDGGPAVRAELSGVSDLAVAPDGTLYIADGGHVRTVSRDGVIRTIAGDGQPHRTIADGTPARSAALGRAANPRNPLHIALSPAGQLYIAGASQILRLTAAGTLERVRAVITAGPGEGPLGGGFPIAIDSRGNIDAGGGRGGGWPIWQLAPNGIAHYVGNDRGSGGSAPVLQRGPGGAVYTEERGEILRIEAHRLLPLAAFNGPISSVPPQPGGQRFPTIHFAFSPSGTIYADDIPGGIGFGLHQQLLAIRNRHVSRLWQEHNATPSY